MKSLYTAEKDMEDMLKRVEEEMNRIEKREDQRSQMTSLPLDLWLESGFDEGGILVIHSDLNIRNGIASQLRIRGYKVNEASNNREASSAFKKSSYVLMIIPWVIYEKSSDFVSLLRKAFPQTRIIITSPSFAWSSESVTGAELGKMALNAGAYSYVPDNHISEVITTCVQSATKANLVSCPVLLAGLPCNLRCVL